MVGRRIAGTLWLWQSSSLDSSPKTGKHVAPRDTVSHPYYGATDLNLWDLTRKDSAVAESLRARIDPVYPQIMIQVRGWPPADYSQWKEFTLWVESVANARDGTEGLDGAGFVLEAVRLDHNGFDGRWGPAGIMSTDTGFFCARRSHKKRS